MWDQLTTFRSLNRAEKHYSLKEQPLNMPLGTQNPYAKKAYCYQELTTELLTVNFHCFKFSYIKISVVGDIIDITVLPWT